MPGTCSRECDGRPDTLKRLDPKQPDQSSVIEDVQGYRCVEIAVAIAKKSEYEARQYYADRPNIGPSYKMNCSKYDAGGIGRINALLHHAHDQWKAV